MTVGVYKITSQSGKCYIGQSVNVEKRLKQHRASLKIGTHKNERLLQAYKKYKGGLTFSLVAEVPKQHLTEVEQFLIDWLPSNYNISSTAHNPLLDPEVEKRRIDAAFSEEAKRKRKVAVDKYWSTPGVRELRGAEASARNAMRPPSKTRQKKEAYAALTTEQKEERKAISLEKFKARTKELNADTGFRKKQKEAVIEWSNKNKDLLSALSKQRWKDPEFREKIIASRKASYQRPEVKAARVATSKGRWEKYGNNILAASIEKRQQDFVNLAKQLDMIYLLSMEAADIVELYKTSRAVNSTYSKEQKLLIRRAYRRTPHGRNK
jgi:group I intron endonuclease